VSRRHHRVAIIAVALCAITAFAAVPAAAAPKESPRKAPSGRAFYDPPDPLPQAAPGTLIWSAPFKAIPGAQAWKVLYHSRAVNGADIAVSGVVVAPTDAPPSGGRPVISWAHGTHGIADKCAPSRTADMVSLLPSIGKLVAQGYVVVATDYEGLGTPGPHPYLVGQSEAHGVLDIVKAAQQIRETGANDKTFVWGQSQGGQAALFAGELAPTYAPQLDVVGVVSGAPVTDATTMFPAAATIPDTLGFAVMGLYGMQAAYPDAKVSDVLTPAGLDTAKIIDQRCYGAVLSAFKKPVDQIIAHNPADVPPFPQIFASDTPGQTPTKAPMLVYQGASDDVVFKTFTDAYVKKACTLGNTIQYATFSGAGHYDENDIAQKDVLEWMQARLAGLAPPSTC
jgi:alpha-beta hydrolase superfamily lysophospholipase